MKDAHTTLADCCVRFLSLLDEDSNLDTDQIKNIKDDTFLEYAAESWALHLRESRICDDELAAITPLAFKLSNPNNKAYSVWSRVYWGSSEYSVFRTILMVASFFGHIAVAKRSLEEGADVNAKGGHYGNAL